MSVEEVFAKVVGRQASQEERERLHRLRDALGLHDNDAFWSIVMALEYYDAFFRQYPEKIAQATAQSVEHARAAFAAAAAHEAALVQRTLSEQVARASVALAQKLAEKPVGLHRFTLALAAVVAFGAVCVHAGTDLAPGLRSVGPPVAPSPRGALAIVLSIPAGWMIFALLLPSAAHGARLGWTLAGDPVAEPARRAIGWCILVLSVAGFLGCAAMVAEVT